MLLKCQGLVIRYGRDISVDELVWSGLCEYYEYSTHHTNVSAACGCSCLRTMLGQEFLVD